MSEDTDFLYPFIEGDERDAGALLADLARSAVAKGATSAALPTATLDRARRPRSTAAADAMADAFAAGGRLFTFGNGGSSTDAASLAALFARPPRGRAAAGPLPGRRPRGAHRARQRRRLRPRVLAPADRARRARRHRPRHLDQRQLAQPARRVRGSGRRGPAHRRPRGLRRRRDGRDRARARTASSCASDSVHRIQETQAALGFALWCGGAGATRGGRGTRVVTRGAARRRPRGRGARSHHAFRRRRPRLTDDVVTLAHGAGGKASAALVDAVFLEAFADGEPGPLPDAATLTLPSGERLAFSTDSFVVQAAALPRRVDRSPRGARHRQRPRGAGRGRRRGCRPRS